MKFLFLDEFKFEQAGGIVKTYGLAGVLIDALHYTSFKESFYTELEKVGWDKNLELKGKSMFSSKGDQKVKVKDRINFMTNVVSLSQSASGKNARMQVFVHFDVFEGEKPESFCYMNILEKIINKIPAASNKKKNLVAVLYDNNDSIDNKDLNNNIGKFLNTRKLKLFESAISVRSSMDFPGIMFADYVCYFHQTFLQLSKFRKDNMNEFGSLIKKYEEKQITDNEQSKLDSYIINFKKEIKTRELIGALKKVIYI